MRALNPQALAGHPASTHPAMMIANRELRRSIPQTVRCSSARPNPRPLHLSTPPSEAPKLVQTGRGGHPSEHSPRFASYKPGLAISHRSTQSPGCPGFLRSSPRTHPAPGSTLANTLPAPHLPRCRNGGASAELAINRSAERSPTWLRSPAAASRGPHSQPAPSLRPTAAPKHGSKWFPLGDVVHPSRRIPHRAVACLRFA